MFGIGCVLLLAYQLVAQARVAHSVITQEDLSSCVDCRSQRTLFNIIWGCISTTIICAWAAIHPNIPHREGPFKKTLRRLELMFWTVVAPEILPCWALNQRLAAITAKDVYNNWKGSEKTSLKRCRIWETVKGWFSLYEIKEAARPEWTITHGHFLVMGGFHVVEPPENGTVQSTEANTSQSVDVLPPPTSALLVEEASTDTEKGHAPSENKPAPAPEHGRVTILTLEMLEELVKDPEFKIQITEEEIADRSKGDALSKVIFIMQSSWFILQCVGRRVQGLDLTQLELTTLALASLNGITFLLWWDKPLGAQSVVRIYLKRKLTDSERRVEGRDNSLRSTVIGTTQLAFENCMTMIRGAFLCQPEGLVQLPFAILLLLLSPILLFAFAFFSTLADLLGASTSFPADDTHVPTFYVPKHRYSEWYHTLLLVTLGAIFGGIHLSGWNFLFPTYAEQKLWRVASLAVTMIPIAIFPFTFILHFVIKRILLTMVDDIPTISTYFLSTLAYVLARLALLGLALSLLRHLPPTAFIAIDWTKFYPHIL